MFGDTIRMLRSNRHLTIEELAGAIGVMPQAIENYESNIWQPGKPVIKRLATFFGITTQELISGYSLLYDDETREILVVRNMGGNRIRLIGRLSDKSHRIERKEVDDKCSGK